MGAPGPGGCHYLEVTCAPLQSPRPPAGLCATAAEVAVGGEGRALCALRLGAVGRGRRGGAWTSLETFIDKVELGVVVLETERVPDQPGVCLRLCAPPSSWRAYV